MNTAFLGFLVDSHPCAQLSRCPVSDCRLTFWSPSNSLPRQFPLRLTPDHQQLFSKTASSPRAYFQLTHVGFSRTMRSKQKMFHLRFSSPISTLLGFGNARPLQHADLYGLSGKAASNSLTSSLSESKGTLGHSFVLRHSAENVSDGILGLLYIQPWPIRQSGKGI